MLLMSNTTKNSAIERATKRAVAAQAGPSVDEKQRVRQEETQQAQQNVRQAPDKRHRYKGWCLNAFFI